jgi:hypothetical protein
VIDPDVQAISFQVAKLDVRPDDIVVLKTPDVIYMQAQLVELRRQLREAFPQLKFMVLPHGMDIEILRQQVAEACEA